MRDDRQPPDHHAERLAPGGSGNFEARLARALVRSSGGAKWRTIVVAAIAVMWFALTFTGSVIGSNQPSVGGRFGDGLYNTLTFLAPRDGYGGVGRYPNLPPLLWWGRFFGVALSTLAILWAALYQSRRLLAGVLIQSRAKGHLVVISANGFADALARGSADEGLCVVLVERGVPSDRIQELGRAGVFVAPEQATLEQSLRNCRVDHASRVVSWMPSDSSGLSGAISARQTLDATGTEIVVRIDSPQMQRSLRNAPELLRTRQANIRSVSPTILAARQALSGPQLVREACRRRLERVHVILHGDTAVLGVIASLLLRNSWSMHLQPPKVSWGIRPHDHAWREWRSHNYCYIDHLHEAFEQEEAPVIRAVDDESTVPSGGVAIHIVDRGDDDATLATAFDLASKLAQIERTATPVQAVLRSAHASRELLLHAGSSMFAEPILLGAEPSFGAVLNNDLSGKEMAIHRAFAASTAAARTLGSWSEVEETYVQATQAFDDHRTIKEFDIATARAGGMGRDTLVAALAATEHRRWTTERLLDGWAPAPQRDNDRRLHDKLVPWSALPEADRAKNIAAIEATFGTVLDQAAAPR